MGINDLLSIGSNIKKFRKEKGYSQKQFAEEILQIPRSAYPNYENGNRIPDPSRLEKLLMSWIFELLT